MAVYTLYLIGFVVAFANFGFFGALVAVVIVRVLVRLADGLSSPEPNREPASRANSKPHSAAAITTTIAGSSLASIDDSDTSSVADINPATGLPMTGGIGGVDVAGNPYGTDLSDTFDSSTSISDDLFTSGIDDSFSSGIDDDNF